MKIYRGCNGDNCKECGDSLQGKYFAKFKDTAVCEPCLDLARARESLDLVSKHRIMAQKRFMQWSCMSLAGMLILPLASHYSDSWLTILGVAWAMIIATAQATHSYRHTLLCFRVEKEAISTLAAECDNAMDNGLYRRINK